MIRPVKFIRMAPSSLKWDDRKKIKAKHKNKNNNQNTTQHFGNPSTSQQNPYMDLDPDEDLSDTQSIYSTRASPNKKSLSQKPPPLTMTRYSYAQVTNILKNFQDEYSLKLSPVGVQIFPGNTESFKKIKNHLFKENHQFFTHDLREEQLSKFVLHGYIETSEATLMSQLEDLELEPEKVNKMKIHQKKHNDHNVYLIYFKKTQNVKISQLREIKSIENVIVKWEYYSNRRQGPTQCSNCQAFGHGGNNCRLLPRCIRCSGPHKSINCPKLLNDKKMQTRTRIPDNELICANCDKNHAANFSKCEKRLEVIERLKKYRNKTQNQTKSTHHGFKPSPELSDFHYPRMNIQNPQPIDEDSSKNQQPSSTNNSLYSAAELMTIFKEMMIKMQQAKSKIDQVSILGELVIKYASN